MRNILKRKTTAGVLAVFHKAIADLKGIEAASQREIDKVDDQVAKLRDRRNELFTESDSAISVRLKLEELIEA